VHQTVASRVRLVPIHNRGEWQGLAGILAGGTLSTIGGPSPME
jgi:hypothetical protein